jgi:hypothetical protein
MQKTITISGLEQMVRLLNQHPEFMALGSLAPIKYVGEQAAATSRSCGCNAAEVYQKNRPVFEAALQNLGLGDHLVVKRLLGVDRICYYVKDKAGNYRHTCI